MPQTQLDPTNNFALVDLFTGYDASATTVVLQAGQGALLPDPATEGAYDVTWFNRTQYPTVSTDTNKEIVRVTAKSSDTLTITRAQQGTSATTKNAVGDTYSMVLGVTEKNMTDIQTYIRRQAGQLATSTGSANAQLLAVDANITTYNTGDRFSFIAGYTNTGATTFNVNSISAKNVFINGGALPAYTIKAGMTYELMYDGTQLVLIGGSTAVAPVLVSRIEFSNSSTAQNTGTIPNASLYKYYEIKIAGYRNTNSGTGSIRCAVNALAGTAYQHTNQIGNTTFGAESTGNAYWTLYSAVTTHRSLAYSWIVSNIKAGDSKAMFAMLSGYYHSTVAVNGAVNLGSDTEINTLTFTPMDGASADPITAVIEIFGHY